ncbi:MAG: serine/threonine-protein kinase [Deltaproteobacteria bacterium]
MNEPESPTIKVAITGEDGEDSPDRPEPSDTVVAKRYRLARRIGKGGMGEVMAARDEQVGRDVAIKRMRAAHPSDRAIARFLREASVQGRLEHPAIVPVHEIGRDDDNLPFFVMKKVSGTALASLVAYRDEPTQQRMLRAFVDVCLAMEFAHVRGIVHRDLKPDNIMLGDFGEVYILDWGVAKVIGEHEDFDDVDSGSGEHATKAGTAIGTPGYMSPEQVRGSDIDGRADIYTLGCLLYEVLAGEPLHPRGFHGLESAVKGLDARPSQRGHGVPPELDALCVAATQKDRDDRIATARELGESVQRYLDGDRDVALRRQLARDHLERARTAFANEDVATQRPVAMREAAAALALDPALDGPAELVGRLMLEPPSVTPPEVEESIQRDNVRSARVLAAAGLWVVIAAIAFLPLLWWLSDGENALLGLLAVMLAADGLLGQMVRRAKRPRPELIIIANMLLVFVIARMFSPLLIAPGIAASIAIAMVLTPQFSWLGSPVGIVVSMSLGVLAPLLFEELGWMSNTMIVGTHGLTFETAAFAGHRIPTLIVAVVYVIALISGAVVAGSSMRRQQREAHRRLHLQAWQLRQLVPR